MDDIYFLKKAYQMAYLHSTDPSTQNGAVLVDPITNTAVAFGANHFPEGVKETPERWERPAKYSWVEHAERNSIYDAAQNGVATKKLIMYCPWLACADCARAMIQSGIRHAVTHHDPNAETRFGMPVSSQWKDSIAVAFEMFKEAGVQVNWIDDKIYTNDELKIRFNGKMISP